MGNRLAVRVVNMPKNRSFLPWQSWSPRFLPACRSQRAPEKRATAQEFAAQTVRRPHIVIRPRRIEPGPNAKRYCRFWLAKEYRVSGPVIVPQQQCRWR